MSIYTLAEEIALLDNSIERVINTSTRIARAAERSSNEALAEAGSMNWQDWEALKPLVCRLWQDAAETVRRERMGRSMPTAQHQTTPTK